MVLKPGRYSWGDYFHLGTPIAALVGLVTPVLVVTQVRVVVSITIVLKESWFSNSCVLRTHVVLQGLQRPDVNKG